MAKFDWVQYLIIARELATRPDNESALRSSISRAYYAAYDWEIIIRPKPLTEFDSLEDLRLHLERLRAEKLEKLEKDYHREEWDQERIKALQRWMDGALHK